MTETMSNFFGGAAAMRNLQRLAFFTGLLWLAAAHNTSPEQLQEPPETYRQDFEKRGIGRLFDHWDPVTGKGYPHYNKCLPPGRQPGHSGTGYLVIRTLGGNTAYETHQAFLPASPDRSYFLRGWFRTVQARNNRAYLSLHWQDETGAEIEVHKSTLMPHAEEWTEITLAVEKIKPHARAVRIRLNYDGPDVRGECWFDDIELVSQDKIVLDTHQHPGNIFHVDEAKRVTLSVPSFRTAYTLHTSVRDFFGQVVVPTQTLDAGPGQARDLTLPLHIPGYYEIEIVAGTPAGARSRKTAPLLVVDDVLVRDGEKDFALVVNPYLTGHDLGLFYTQTLGAQTAKIVLRDAMSARGSSMNDTKLLDLVRSFLDRKIELTAVVGRPHAASSALSPRPDLDDPILAQTQGQDAEEKLREMIRLFGDYIRYWQFLREGDTTLSDPATADAIMAGIQKILKEQGQSLSLGMALKPGTPAGPLKTPRFFSIDTTGLEDISALERVPDLQDRKFHYTLSPQRLQAGDRREAMTRQLAHMMQRCIVSKKAGIPRLYWELQGDPLSSLLDSDGLPMPPYLALRTMNHLLSGAQVQDKHIFPAPIQDIVFQKDDETIIAFWSAQGTIPLDLYLGEEARIIDGFGRITPMSPNTPLRVGPIPMFLVGINTELIDTQASLRFDDETLPLRGAPSTRTLHFQNRFQTNMKDVKITLVKITDQKQNRRNWLIQPVTMARAEIPPQGKISESILFNLPLSESDGPYTALLQLSFRTDRKYETKLVRPIRVGAVLRLDHRIASGVVADTKRLHLTLTNDGTRKVDLKALVTLPSMPTREINIAGLDVKQSYEMPFTLPRYESLKGQKVRIKIFETSGDLFTNKEIVLE